MMTKKVNNKTVYPKAYICVVDGKDNRKITVVGIVDTTKITVSSNEEAEYQEGNRIRQTTVDLKRKLKMKELRVAYSICHPDDVKDYDLELGIHIAKKRCYSRPMTILTSPYLGEFREDLVKVILRAKGEYIANSIESGDAKFLKA